MMKLELVGCNDDNGDSGRPVREMAVPVFAIRLSGGRSLELTYTCHECVRSARAENYYNSDV